MAESWMKLVCVGISLCIESMAAPWQWTYLAVSTFNAKVEANAMLPDTYILYEDSWNCQGSLSSSFRCFSWRCHFRIEKWPFPHQKHRIEKKTCCNHHTRSIHQNSQDDDGTFYAHFLHLSLSLFRFIEYKLLLWLFMHVNIKETHHTILTALH